MLCGCAVVSGKSSRLAFNVVITNFLHDGVG